MVCTDDPTPTWLTGATSSALKAQRFSQLKEKKKKERRYRHVGRIYALVERS